MKITIEQGEFSHIYDDSVNTKINGGFIEEGYTNVHNAIDAVLRILCNFYDKKKIAQDIKEGDYSIMDALIEK